MFNVQVSQNGAVLCISSDEKLLSIRVNNLQQSDDWFVSYCMYSEAPFVIVRHIECYVTWAVADAFVRK